MSAMHNISILWDNKVILKRDRKKRGNGKGHL